MKSLQGCQKVDLTQKDQGALGPVVDLQVDQVLKVNHHLVIDLNPLVKNLAHLGIDPSRLVRNQNHLVKDQNRLMTGQSLSGLKRLELLLRRVGKI
jgi:hypothetical protein